MADYNDYNSITENSIKIVIKTIYKIVYNARIFKDANNLETLIRD